MKNIFLEVGAYDLSRITMFYNDHQGEEWEFKLFEPNPISIEVLKEQISSCDIPNISLYEVAAYVSEEEKIFYLGSRSQVAASLCYGKGHLNTESPIKVNCIDFSKWIKDNLNKDDNIHMNMDIEGAEYYVLPKMILEGSIDYINDIEIEFHAHKFRGENKTKFYKIHSELKEYFNKSEYNLDRIWRL
jgi:FkbM family methyltransferase